jgi:hypothetical protein
VNFTLYPIHGLSDEIDGEPFSLQRLPFAVIRGVTLESVNQRFHPETFVHMRGRLGSEIVEKLTNVRYAIVHRYEPEPIIVDGEILGEQMRDHSSEKLIRTIASCLRLIRPMRQDALLMRGRIRPDDQRFEVTGCDIPPLHLIEVPEVQKLFGLRDRDADDLQSCATEFTRAMEGESWKFRMAVQFHDLGHFQAIDWKARFLLWCSAIESLYTSHNWEHQGSLVATARIKWFLGENTNIYPPGDISDLLEHPQITVGDVVDELYEMRNFIAHGDRLPEEFFTTAMRRGFNGDVYKREVLIEAASFIIRTSLLRVLREQLLHQFASATSAEAYFEAQNLTKSALRRPR